MTYARRGGGGLNIEYVESVSCLMPNRRNMTPGIAERDIVAFLDYENDSKFKSILVCPIKALVLIAAE